MIQIIINYDPTAGIYKLYNKDLDVLFTAEEMFKVLVIFNTYLMELYGENFNILKSDEIEYILDSASMKQMIISNVQLLKRLSRAPSAFQESAERFGNSSISTPSVMRKSNGSFNDFDNMMSKRKQFKSSKFK